MALDIFENKLSIEDIKAEQRKITILKNTQTSAPAAVLRNKKKTNPKLKYKTDLAQMNPQLYAYATPKVAQSYLTHGAAYLPQSYQNWSNGELIEPQYTSFATFVSNVGLTQPMTYPPVSYTNVASNILMQQLYPSQTQKTFQGTSTAANTDMTPTPNAQSYQESYDATVSNILNIITDEDSTASAKSIDLKTFEYSPDSNNNTKKSNENEGNEAPRKEDPIEAYLKLPHEFFGKPEDCAKLSLNDFIDVFCLCEHSFSDMLFLLDVELGSAHKPNKSAAVYDIQYGSILSSTGGNHPGFERCGTNFQKWILYYYDSIVSAWYLGFVSYYADPTIKTFTNWLTPIMHALGVYWR